MSPSHQTIKRAWITAGSSKLWNPQGHGTYFTIEHSRLSPLTHWSPGFAWLSDFPERDYGCALDSEENKIENFDRLSTELKSLGHVFPAEFNQFISHADIQAQIPSCTACYLELSEAVTPLPGHPGCHVIRFMNDSQCCQLWYLLFQLGVPPKVLTNSLFIERDIFDAMECLDDHDVPLSYSTVLNDASICSDSFEEFIYRFCIENTLWFALNENYPQAKCEREYMKFAKSGAAKSSSSK